MLLPLDLRRARADVAHALSIYRASLWPGVPPALGATDHRVQAGAGLEPAPELEARLAALERERDGG